MDLIIDELYPVQGEVHNDKHKSVYKDQATQTLHHFVNEGTQAGTITREVGVGSTHSVSEIGCQICPDTRGGSTQTMDRKTMDTGTQ
jgi:hypothetical protein